ncbi:TIGR03085 family protein [Pedococcus dokdonensis]|uniref:TIGR03085 family protein n=1 Tax=Pedococcus dokdonensis TaxID=443156 RepID=A0A1H0PGW2_9MICO|nr:TIGR03085 family metal-binding protein [Pedococcus dokdonensis]SDP03846.1 TIGR03085 family protein [Pedococcus dokdonensis]
MTHLARIERESLCDTFDQVGPDAPTLCSPWTTADLAAHLVIRERRPDLAPGIWLPPLAGRLEESQADYAGKPWPELVDLIRSGPPAWSPAQLSSVDDAVNFLEFFIHHEDVLRGDGQVGPRREVPLREQKALWKTLKRLGKVFFRRSPVGVVLERTDGKVLTVKGPTELGTVTVRGDATELVLAAYGRRRVADLSVAGDDAAVQALWEAPLGLS